MTTHSASEDHNIPDIDLDEIRKITNEIHRYYKNINHLWEHKLKQPSEEYASKESNSEFFSSKSESFSEKILESQSNVAIVQEKKDRPKEQKLRRPSEELSLRESRVKYESSKSSASYKEKCFINESRIEPQQKIKVSKPSTFSSCSIPPIPLEMTFAEKLFALMDNRGMTSPQVYKAANLDKSLFSKITSDKNYSPSKETAISIALALCLNLRETIDLLERAGFTLSHSTMRDAAVEYCIKEKIFNVVKVNIILDELGCQPLSRGR